MTDLKITAYTKKELKVAIDGPDYDNHRLVGLSKNKIYWLLKNDRIEDDDYCIVQAKDGELLVADIFMVPDLIRTKNTEKVKVYWMVNWWLHPKYENTIVGTYLYSEASRLANHKILVESYLEKTSKFYEKQPYVCILERKRFVLFFAVDEHLILNKLPKLKRFKTLIQPVTKLFSYFLRQFNSSKVKKHAEELTYEYYNELSDATWKFIAPFLKNDVAYKTKAYINWQLCADQYVQTPITLKTVNKAILKGTAQDIHNCTFSVYKKNIRLGFVSFVRIDRTIYLKYCIASEANKIAVIHALVEHIIHFKITSIYTDDARVAQIIQDNYNLVYTHVSNKRALAHKLLKEELNGLTLSEGDGNFH